jgi:hypothetical protein
MLAACTTSAPDGHLVMRLRLDQTRTVHGSPITAHVTFVNHSSVALALGCSDSFFVGLSNPKTPFRPVIATSRCPDSAVRKIKPGHTYEETLTIFTSYYSCDGDRPESDGTPMCEADDSIPPLPVGVYSTQVLSHGLPQNTEFPASIAVTLTG